jgi:hypothetical protein
MGKCIAALSRQGTILFNFWLRKQSNDKRIGDLTMQDFIEMVAFLAETGDQK